MAHPTLEEIQQAHERIRSFAHRTPVLSSTLLNEFIGSEVFLKCENFQKVGAFKFRGASNAIFSLSDDEAKHGVATHSSGNHAQAVALAAKIREIPAFVVMPENAPKVKVKAVKDYGAEVTFCEPTLEARESTLNKITEKNGARLIHPYDDKKIVTGQATAALEFLQDYPNLDVVMAPVGGGGLLSGTALTVKYLEPDIQVIGAEPKAADDAYQSFKSGKIIPVQQPDTIADGLKTSLGEIPFSIIKEKVDDILTVSEDSIIEAMKFIWERMKIIIEPSSAVPIAALMEGKVDINEKKVGVILSGGNIDFNHLPF